MKYIWIVLEIACMTSLRLTYYIYIYFSKKNKKSFLENRFPLLYEQVEKVVNFFETYVFGGPLYLWRAFYQNGPERLQMLLRKWLYIIGNFIYIIGNFCSNTLSGFTQATLLRSTLPCPNFSIICLFA